MRWSAISGQQLIEQVDQCDLRLLLGSHDRHERQMTLRCLAMTSRAASTSLLTCTSDSTPGSSATGAPGFAAPGPALVAASARSRGT